MQAHLLFLATYHPDGLKSVDVAELSRFMTEESISLLDCPRCGSLQIDIIDHGPGIGREEMARLFQEGVQFNPNQLQAGQGSGLGLWISRGLVELHLGKLSAHSEGLGLGSTFSIEIPLVEHVRLELEPGVDYDVELGMHQPEYTLLNQSASIEPTLEKVNFDETIETSAIPLDIKKILIVDDTPTNRKIVRRILRSDGFTDVDEAKDGQECVEMVSSRPPSEPWYDLILMDFEMPRMNGPTATSRLRELGYSMPIIGVTGNILTSDVTYFLESGASSVLPKPIVMKDLYEAYHHSQSHNSGLVASVNL
jgi:CheY-like chemotaxis protein